MELVERGRARALRDAELIGANADAIATAEDRERFKAAMLEIGLAVPPPAASPHTLDEAVAVVARRSGCPVIIRPAYILGGRGTGIAIDAGRARARSPPHGLDASPIREILIERSIAGWKEYELEVMRDRADNCVVICSIENLDPMGVHTGDSITVAPAQTLSRRRVPAHARRGLRLHPAGRAWRPAAPTSSSRWTRRTATWSSSR